MNSETRGVRNSYWMATAVFDERVPFDTFELVGRLEKQGIDTRPFFSPLSSLAPYAGRGDAKAHPTSYALARCAVNLPSALSLEEADVDRVTTALKQVLSR